MSGGFDPIRFPGARLYLRDAVAILPDGRRDLPERLQRGAELARRFDLNLEITLDARFFVEGNTELLAAISLATGAFESTAYHLHTSPRYPFGDNRHTAQLVDFCQDLAAGGHLRGVCVHPDLVADFDAFRPLVSDDFYVAGEVLDETCDSFNTFASIADMLGRYDYLGLVLDTAHIAGMEPAGEPPYTAYCEAFRDRVVEVHISQTGNLYDAAEMGPGFGTNHSLLTLGENKVAAALAPLAGIAGLHLVIEGVIPAAEYGKTLLSVEVAALTAFMQARS